MGKEDQQTIDQEEVQEEEEKRGRNPSLRKELHSKMGLRKTVNAPKVAAPRGHSASEQRKEEEEASQELMVKMTP